MKIHSTSHYADPDQMKHKMP